MTAEEFYAALVEVPEEWFEATDGEGRPIIRTAETDRCPIHAVFALNEYDYRRLDDQRYEYTGEHLTNFDVNTMGDELQLDPGFISRVVAAADGFPTGRGGPRAQEELKPLRNATILRTLARRSSACTDAPTDSA